MKLIGIAKSHMGYVDIQNQLDTCYIENNGNAQLAAFPASKSTTDIKELQTMHENITNAKSSLQPESCVGHLIPANAPAYHRMREQLATRNIARTKVDLLSVKP